MDSGANRQVAIRHFEQARQQARLSEIGARLTGKNNRLLPFDEIRAAMRLYNPMYRGIQQIDVAQVVGSVGRYGDFTRTFTPLSDSVKERWVGVETLATTQGWPPIEVYQVGKFFFVKDGNHRTAVARSMGNRTIEAHVWEYPDAAIDIDTAADLDEILIELGRDEFAKRTHIDDVDPDHTIQFTVPGRYSELYAQIENVRHIMATMDARDVAYDEAVLAWYEWVYQPTMEILRETTLLDEFPGRTEADLFVWLSKHRARLGERYGKFVDLPNLAQLLVEQYAETGVVKAARAVRNLIIKKDVLPPLPEDDDDGEVISAETIQSLESKE